MSNKPKLRLSEPEAQLLRGLCYARMVVLKAGDPHSVEDLPLNNVLDEHTARMALPVFDFYRSVAMRNIEAVKRLATVYQGPAAVRQGFPAAVYQDTQTSGGYYDGLIADYKAIIAKLEISIGSVLHLYRRIKDYIKGQKNPPPQILYISDCHFYDDDICREMDTRGFSGYEEMNEAMVRRWNEKVRDKDSVYILGDFSIAKSDATEKIIRRLRGKLHLIIGNHDWFLQDKRFDRSLFQSIEAYQEIRDNGRKVILSHYPVFCYNGQYRRDEAGQPRTYMLYGHVHNTHDEALVNRFIQETRETKAKPLHATEPEPIPCNMINCFCMFSNYQPMALDEWIEIDTKRRALMKESSNSRKKMDYESVDQLMKDYWV